MSTTSEVSREEWRRRAMEAEREQERLVGDEYWERRALAAEAEAQRLREEDNDRFQAYLDWASAEVKTWPEWKRNCLRRYPIEQGE